ncbi:hypothetical protein HMN09_01380200 [Mycena chlorophos]|uniref:Phosphoglycerate mutase-like protein n=1 Tax=Mycena chlorophos TaxID=658473 RepID=A0A8H6VNQ3_MYCCL|nr:hypothetical protein HMN09_01380200 [Mycena chlorophos]
MAKGSATFTFIRHGESTDNVRSVWAGWADATLTVHGDAGMQQAQALAASFSSTTRFDAILSSPLKRARMTAEEIQKQQPQSPALTTSALLKERNFGVAEGKPTTWKRDFSVSLADNVSSGIYPQLSGRSEKFPEGECLDEVAVRAAEAWKELLLPFVRTAAETGSSVHVAVVSHGIFIREAFKVLAAHDKEVDLSIANKEWLRNTGWTRVVVCEKDGLKV